MPEHIIFMDMKLNNVLRSFATVLIGILLIVMKDSAIHLLVRIVGVAFFVPALVSASGIFINKRDRLSARDMMFLALDVCCLAFGLWLIISPEMLVGLLVVLLALALFSFSLFQLYRVYFMRNLVQGLWRYAIVPLALVVVSVTVLALPGQTVSFLTMMIGIAAVLSGLSDIVISLVADKNDPQLRK